MHDLASSPGGIALQGRSQSKRMGCGSTPSVIPVAGMPDASSRRAIFTVTVDLPEPIIPSTITSLGQTLLDGGIKVE
jgi:hypothetical protein